MAAINWVWFSPTIHHYAPTRPVVCSMRAVVLIFDPRKGGRQEAATSRPASLPKRAQSEVINYRLGLSRVRQPGISAVAACSVEALDS